MFRQLGVVPAAAEALLSLARLEAEREHYDQALALLEQAEQWIADVGDTETQGRAGALRREIERQYVAVSLSTCNEFRALEEANRLFRETADMDGLLAAIVKLAVEHSGGDRGFVAFSASPGRLDVVAQHGLGRDRARRALRVLETVAGARFAESGPMFSSRVAADPRFGAALTDALEGVGSLVCVPLNFPSQAVGLVYVDRLNDNLLGAFKQKDLNLLAVLANSAAVAIVEAQRSLLLAENQQLRDKLRPSPGSERVISQSREVSDILTLLRKVGDSTASVLFMGETGTGKGLFAQVVHEISPRRDLPFVQVNCAALPEQLLESELFGYVQGAFTGATRDKRGLFEEAEGGTIFLDEIEKIPETVQAKLLHVLDRGEIRPVGATRNKKVDARVICATSSDLRERIRDGRFLDVAGGVAGRLDAFFRQVIAKRSGEAVVFRDEENGLAYLLFVLLAEIGDGLCGAGPSAKARGVVAIERPRDADGADDVGVHADDAHHSAECERGDGEGAGGAVEPMRDGEDCDGDGGGGGPVHLAIVME